MQEIISCPSCHRKLQVPEGLIGQDVQCPTCGATFVGAVNGQSAAPAPHAAPPPSYPVPPPRPARRDYDDRGAYGDDYGPPRDRGYRRDLLPHRGSAVLTLGILSLIPCFITGIILGIIAWVMGQSDMGEIRAGRMDPEGEGITNAGRICGIIGVSLYGGLTVLWLLVVMMSAAAGPRW